jgi:hypothetical protein
VVRDCSPARRTASPGVAGKGQWDGRQAQQGAIAPGTGISVSGERVPIALEAPQGRRDAVADVEADPGAAPLAVPVPAQITAHLVRGVEAPADHQALRQAQGHGGVFCPLTGVEAEGPAAHQVPDRLKGAGQLELQGRPQGWWNGAAVTLREAAMLLDANWEALPSEQIPAHACVGGGEKPIFVGH